MFALYIVLSILILLLMVTIHEFGHYIAGRILGFKINEFSIGFGPAIFQRTNKRGEKISLRIFPLGGFCAFEGEDEGEPAKPKKENVEIDVFSEKESKPEEKANEQQNKQLSFNEQKPWKRIIVLISGALFNIISGFIFSIIFIAVIGNSLPVVGEVYDTPNASIIKENDIIVAVNGKKITIMKDLSTLMKDIDENEDFVLTVLRDDVKTDFSLKKVRYTFLDENKKEQTNVGIGIITKDYVRQSYNIFESIGYAFPFTLKMAGTILSAFGDLLRGIGLNQLSGPVTTVTEMAKLSQANILNVLILLPLIAVNLGIFNLFPIPALDGSKIVFTLIEWIRKKPINRNIENMIHFVGFVLLLGLIIVIDMLKFIR